MLTVFCSPRRYTQASNATLSLGKEMATLGLAGPALIVAGNSAIRLLSDTWWLSLAEAGFSWQVCRFGGECSIAEIERVKGQARKQGVRVIVGAGGGKVLDTARASAADLDLPVVTCPTVASSDAPCSALTPATALFSNTAFTEKIRTWCSWIPKSLPKVRPGFWSPARAEGLGARACAG